MKTLSSFFIVVICLLFAGCSSNETQEQKAKYEFENSISNDKSSKISDVNYRYLSDAETRSIWEVFTGKEFGHGRLFLRTQPENRNGLYFFVMFDTYQKNILKDTEITLFVHSKGNKKIEEFKFKVPSNSSLLRELALGITGSDAQKVSKKVLAWKIIVKDPSGKVITQGQSWLWGIPENKNN